MSKHGPVIVSCGIDPLDIGVSVNGDRILHGLGNRIIDGQWHTITRDLQTELQAAQPDVDVL